MEMADGFSLVMPWFPLWLAHILRGVCILIAPFCMILCFRLSWMEFVDSRRQILFAGLGFLLVASVYTEIDRWDADVTPRLFINVAGVLISFVGLWKMKTYKGVKHGS